MRSEGQAARNRCPFQQRGLNLAATKILSENSGLLGGWGGVRDCGLFARGDGSLLGG